MNLGKSTCGTVVIDGKFVVEQADKMLEKMVMINILLSNLIGIVLTLT
jgi:hypothetical protein